MNSFGYGYVEPVVPPRRKRSLSTSRSDAVQASEDSNFGFPNRMKRNFSTEHIPGQYFNAQRQPPVNNYLQQHYRQQSQPSLLFQQAQGQIPRFLNPYAPQMSKMPIRPHHDYLKYGQGVNVPYNPYNSPFNPTLMARPTIEPFQSTSIPTSISSAIARGRDPALYSSKERLYSNTQNLSGYNKNLSQADYSYNSNKSPPQRPPPPKLNPRSSLDNLHSTTNRIGIIDFQAEYPSRNDLHNRRSVSPTRLSPTGLQKPYNIRRSTSPMPSSLITTSTSAEIGRSPSRMPSNQNYQFRSSREQTPLMSRSPSPLRTSPYSYATNQLYNNSYEHQPVSHQPSNRVSRSSIFGAGAGGSENPYESMNQSTMSTSPFEQSNDKLARTSRQQSSNNLDNNYLQNNNQNGQFNLESNAYSNENEMHQHMDSLQLPMSQQDFYNQDNPNQHNTNVIRQSDSMFSETFTDHCDQYKSLTSKILSKKAKHASGDFYDENYNLNEDFAKDIELPRKLSAQIVATNQGKVEMVANSELPNNILGNTQLEQAPPNDNNIKKVLNDLVETNASSKLIDPAALNQLIRRSSTSNGLTVQQRKGSLPSQYIATPKVIKLSDEWSRENVASMAHEARTHGKQGQQGSTLKKIGVCLTRQFIFLLIAGLNILLAYVFYNLLSALPKDETIHKR